MNITVVSAPRVLVGIKRGSDYEVLSTGVAHANT